MSSTVQHTASTAGWLTRLHGISPSWARPTLERVAASALATRLVHGAFWSLATAAIAKSASLVTWMIVAHLVGRETFGQLSILDNTFALLQTVGLFGLAAMTTRYVAAWKATEQDRAGRVMGLSILLAAASGLILAGGLAASAPWVADRVLAKGSLGAPLRLGSVLLVAYAMNGVLEGAIVGLEGFRQLARVYLVSGLLSVPLYAWGAWAGGLTGVVGMMIVIACVVATMNLALLRRLARRSGLRIRFDGALREFSMLWQFSVPVFLASQTYMGGSWLGSCLVARGSSGYSELGVYSAAVRWQQVVSFLPYYVVRAVFPALTERLKVRDSRAYAQVMKLYLGLATAIAGACALVLAVFARLVMRTYGAGFADGGPVLVVVSFMVLLLPLRWSIEMIYRSVGVAWWELALNVAWVAILLAGVLLLPGDGALRLAQAGLVAFALSNFLAVVHISVQIRRGRWPLDAAPEPPGPEPLQAGSDAGVFPGPQ